MAGPLGSGGARNSAKFVRRNGGVMATLNSLRKRFTAPARRAGDAAAETLMGMHSRPKPRPKRVKPRR